MSNVIYQLPNSKNERVMEGYQEPLQNRGDSSKMNLDLAYRRYSKMVYRTCYSYFKHDDDAADACQEVYLRVVKHFSTFQSRCSIRVWINHIAHNYCRDVLRSRNRIPTLICNEEAYEYICEIPNPEAMDYIALEPLYPTIQDYKGGARVIGRMYFWETYSITEISHILDLTPNTVQRTLQKFRENMNKACKRSYCNLQ